MSLFVINKNKDIVFSLYRDELTNVKNTLKSFDLLTLEERKEYLKKYHELFIKAKNN